MREVEEGGETTVPEGTVYQEHMPLQSGKDVKSDASQRAICHEKGKIAGDSSWDHRIMGLH
jgi:hypothetical protein